MKKQITTLRLSPADRESLARVAADEDVSTAAVMRRAIKRYLREVEQHRQAQPVNAHSQAHLAA